MIRTLSRMPSSLLRLQTHRRVIMRFADSIGLVYFGYVDQSSDEHRLVRGATVSTEHTDNNYCIGSYEGYDITLVERTDTIRQPGKSAQKHGWIILTADLHRNADLPHVFLGPHSGSDLFYAQLFTKYAYLRRVHVTNPEFATNAYLNHFTLYAAPDQSIAAQRLFANQTVAESMAKNMQDGMLEISEGVLYLYADNYHVTTAQLDKMLRTIVWLAHYLDDNLPD